MFTKISAFGALILFYSSYLARVNCQNKCLGVHNYCPGGYKMQSKCVDGSCVCNSQDYDYHSCLPDTKGCKISVDAATSLGKPQYNNQPRQPTYSCTPGSSSSNQYEVHVLSVYEVINRRPPTAGDATVNIFSGGRPDRPLVLVLVSYEPVNWILKLPSDVTISRVILVAYYVDKSSVSGDVNQVQAIERKSYRDSWPTGFGSDSGGGDTVGLLKKIYEKFGVVTSFTSTYKADKWSLNLRSSNGSGSSIVSSSTSSANTVITSTTPTTTIPSTSSTAKLHRKKCYWWNNGYHCSGLYGTKTAACIDGYCVCSFQDYDYHTCLPDTKGCKISVDAATSLGKPQYNNQLQQPTYSCTPGSSSSSQYEVHVLSVYEVINGRPPTAADAAVNIFSGGRSDRPLVLVLASYEPANWILKLPSDVTISRVILVAYYVDKSSVSGDMNQVQTIERKSYRDSWPRGYGSDSGGGDTVGLLKKIYEKFGVVTSFTGTYRADKWSLSLSSSNGLGSSIVSSSTSSATTVITSTTSTPTTTKPSISSTAKLHRKKCYWWNNGYHCSGLYGTKTAVCIDGYCVCSFQDYDYHTCLPDTKGCKISVDAATSLGKPQYNNQPRQPTYSCTPDSSSSSQYEVHVLSVYEVINRRPPTAGDATVNIFSGKRPDRPLVLVLASYEPVNWILKVPSDVTISRVILVAYYVDKSSVSGDVNQVQAIERKSYRASWPTGYGSDAGGGDTVGLLKKIYEKFGVVTSFTGTYKADKWSLSLRSSNGSGSSIVSSSTSSAKTVITSTTPTTTIPSTSSTAKLHRKKCYWWNNGYHCFDLYGTKTAACIDGYCVCSFQDYDYHTCLPDTKGCKISVDAATSLGKPQYNNQPRQPTYSCTPGSSSSSQYEVHVLSVYEVISRRPPTAGDATVNIFSGGRSDRPLVLVLASYEPVNWILKLPSDVTISRVILVAYYVDKSSVSGDVNQVQAIERKSYRASWPTGFGSDSGGGDTVGLLKKIYEKFGVVTSFTGTYKADKWSLNLRSSNGLGSSIVSSSTPSANTVITSTTLTTTIPSTSSTAKLHRKKCYWWNNGYHCFDLYGTKTAACIDGYCVCSFQDYDYHTCLPDTKGCKILVDAATSLGKPQYNNQPRQPTYSCTPDSSSSSQYEVHVLSVYEVISRRPPTAGDANVNIFSGRRPDRPLVLVLANYEPVNWILQIPSNITISRVILVAYYVDESLVSGDVNQVLAIERKSYPGSWPRGIGSDSGGGDTVGLLKKIYERFGVVTSFTGTYRADKWSLNLSSQSHEKKTKSSCHEVVEKLSKRIELLSEEVKNHKMKIISLKEKRDESFAPQISSGGPIQKIHRNLASIFAITVLTAHIYLVM